MEKDILEFLSNINNCCRAHNVKTIYITPNFITNFCYLFFKCFPEHSKNTTQIRTLIDKFYDQGFLVYNMDATYFFTSLTAQSIIDNLETQFLTAQGQEYYTNLQ